MFRKIFLNGRIEAINKDLVETENRIADFKKKYGIGNFGGETKDKFEQLMVESKGYEQELTAQMVKMYQLNDIEKYVNNFKSNDELIPSTLGVAEPTMGSMIAIHNELALKRQNHMGVGYSSDPYTQKLNDQIIEQRKNILRAVGQLKNNLQTQMEASKRRQDRTKYEMSSLPQKEREFIDIDREARVKANLLQFLLQKREEIQLTLASNRPEVRVIDEPRIGGLVQPVAFQIKLFALLIGLALPIIIDIIIKFFNNTISDRKEVEELTSIPIIGEVLFNKTDKNIVINTKDRSALAEQFRLLRTNAQYLAADKTVQSAMITSYISGEGKSFISLNFAVSVSLTGDRKSVV